MDSEGVVGLILGGRKQDLESIINSLENKQNVKLYYVCRGSSKDFLVIVRAKKRGRKSEGNIDR